MRRIRIAIFILLLAAALSAASHFAVFRVTQSVQAQLSGIRAAAGAQNYENAAHQIDALLEYYGISDLIRATAHAREMVK